MELTLRQYYIGKALQGVMSNAGIRMEWNRYTGELSWGEYVKQIVTRAVDALDGTDNVPEVDVFQNYDTIPIGYFTERLRRSSSKSMATRFMNACAFFDINTIGELVKFNSTQFMRARNIGRTMIEAIGRTLQEYGIESW